MRRRTTRARVDLPEPLSPTRPSVVPGWMLQADLVHRPDRPVDPAEHAAAEREILDEVGHLRAPA